MTIDAITIEILPDGTIKSSTDKIGKANHDNAEQFLRNVDRLAGGKVEVAHKHGGQGHHHHHGEESGHVHH